MRTAMLAVLILCMATWSWAGPASMKSAVPIRGPAPDQGLCWYQAPHYYVWSLNASTAFGSEVADDLPRDMCPLCVYGFVFYASEWEGPWQDPAGFYLDMFYQDCPPPPRPTSWARVNVVRYYFPWGGDGFSQQVYYSDPGSFECREVLQLSDYALGPRWWCNSLGVVLDTPWGTTPPYAGVAVTDYYVYYGCGQAYWCCEYYGIPRWVTLSSYFGVSADLAYGIICSYDPCWRVDRVPAGPGDRPADEPTTWSMLKTLYR